MNECIYLHSYQIPSTNENLWKVLKRLCCKSVDSDSCCLILQEKSLLTETPQIIFLPPFPSLCPPRLTNLIMHIMLSADLHNPTDMFNGGVFPLVFLVCLFSFVLTDPFEHFQVQPWPSETRWWGSGACCLATGSKLACVAVVALCNSGFDGWM